MSVSPVWAQNVGKYVKIKTARGAWLSTGKDEAWVEGVLRQRFMVKSENGCWLEFEAMAPFKALVKKGEHQTIKVKWANNRTRCELACGNPPCVCNIVEPLVTLPESRQEIGLTYTDAGKLRVTCNQLSTRVKIICPSASVDGEYVYGLPIPLFPSAKIGGFDEVNTQVMQTLGNNLAKEGITFKQEVGFPNDTKSTPRNAEVSTAVTIQKWIPKRSKTPLKNGGTISINDFFTIITDAQGMVEIILPNQQEIKLHENSEADFEIDYNDLILPIQPRLQQGSLYFRGNSGNVANPNISPWASIQPQGTAYCVTILPEILQNADEESSALIQKGYRYSSELKQYIRYGTLLQVLEGKVDFSAKSSPTNMSIDSDAINKQLEIASNYLPDSLKQKIKGVFQQTPQQSVRVQAGYQSILYEGQAPETPNPLPTNQQWWFYKKD